VQSALRVAKEKDKDKESVRTTGPAAAAAATTSAAPSVKTPPVPSSAAPSLAPPPAPTPRQTVSPSKTKEKKARRLSDIGIFAMWRRKPEKDKAHKDKASKEKSEKEKEKDKGGAASTPTTPAAATTRFSAAPSESKPKTSIASLKPGHGYDGPPMSKAKSATLPSSLMRLPSLEFDREEEGSLGVNGNGKDAGNGNGKDAASGAFRQSSASLHDSSAAHVTEAGALTEQGSPKPAMHSQTLPSRTSGIGRGLTLGRKRTADSNNTAGEKSKESGPPPKIQIALDFPSIAWPSVLDANSNSGAGGGDRFAGSDFLADVRRDLGDLVAGGLGMSLTEEKAGMVLGEAGGSVLGRSRSPVPDAITEEPEKLKTSGQGVEGNGNGHAATVQEPAEAEPQTVPGVPPQVVPQQPLQTQTAQAVPRSAQPQPTRFLVLSKSTTLSTSVKLYTVGGLKVEDEGDIGGGRLSLHKVGLCMYPRFGR
jgi:hypothetical protein